MPSWFLAFTLIFNLIVRKFFVFADAHSFRVYEDTIDVSLCFIRDLKVHSWFYGNKLLLLLSASALNITAPNTVNTDNIEL